jgi:hypothetical protein
LDLVVVEEAVLRLVYCPIDDSDMVADALMKALRSSKVKHFVACLGLCTSGKSEFFLKALEHA